MQIRKVNKKVLNVTIAEQYPNYIFLNSSFNHQMKITEKCLINRI